MLCFAFPGQHFICLRDMENTYPLLFSSKLQAVVWLKASFPWLPTTNVLIVAPNSASVFSHSSGGQASATGPPGLTSRCWRFLLEAPGAPVSAFISPFPYSLACGPSSIFKTSNCIPPTSAAAAMSALTTCFPLLPLSTLVITLSPAGRPGMIVSSQDPSLNHSHKVLLVT